MRAQTDRDLVKSGWGGGWGPAESLAVPAPTSTRLRDHRSLGLWLALTSAASAGTSGTFGKSLLESGWTTTAAVTARVGGSAIVLAIPALLALRGRWHVLRTHAWLLIAYGLVAMAGCQLFYFNAVERISVAVALLIEYLAPVLVIGWLWARTGRRPTPLTVAGVVLAVAGLVLVLDLTGSVEVDAVGVLWALAAAVCLAGYFLLSAHETEGLPPLVMAWAGMVVATAALLLIDLVGAAEARAPLGDVTFMDSEVTWLIPAAGMVLVSTTIAYVAGIAGTRRLGSRLASFVGLTEVMFAVVVAWLFLGELPRSIQLAGGLLIVGGVACVRYDELVAGRADPGQDEPLPPPEPVADVAPQPVSW